MEVPSSPPRTTLLGTIFSPVFNFFSPAKNGRWRWPADHGEMAVNVTSFALGLSASAGSDSPDQAMEAEEIVKQLDMEQAVETPTSTATSTQDLCVASNFTSGVSQLPPLRPPHIPEVSPLAVEEELDADLPPLTGRSRDSGAVLASGAANPAHLNGFWWFCSSGLQS